MKLWGRKQANRVLLAGDQVEVTSGTETGQFGVVMHVASIYWPVLLYTVKLDNGEIHDYYPAELRVVWR